jgi:hypothetical protein
MGGGHPCQTAFSSFEFRGALELFNKVLQEEPRHLEGKYLKGACLHAIGRYTEAVSENPVAHCCSLSIRGRI